MDREAVARLLRAAEAMDSRLAFRGPDAQEQFKMRRDEWTFILHGVPYDDAHRALVRHYTTPGARPVDAGTLRTLAATPPPPRPDRACAWHRVCECSHLPGVCLRGWEDHPDLTIATVGGEVSTGPVQCKVCLRARGKIRRGE